MDNPLFRSSNHASTTLSPALATPADIPASALVGEQRIAQFAALAPAAASDAINFNLVCEFTKYKNTGYSEQFAKGWIPAHQTHKVRGQVVKYASHGKTPSTTIRKRTEERLEWTYKVIQYSVNGKRYDDDLVYTYFFTNNKIATKVRTTGYRDIEHVWGTCEQRPVARKKAKPASGNPARDNSLATSSSGKVRYWQSHQPASVKIIPVDKSDWVELRHGAETRLFIQRHINAVIIESRTPEFVRLHDRIINGEVTALGVATRATEDHQDLQKSKYRHGRIGYFGASHEGDIRRIFLMGQQIDNLRHQNERFLELSLSDLDSDVWWVDRLSQ
jgi:hypothetical protein